MLLCLGWVSIHYLFNHLLRKVLFETDHDTIDEGVKLSDLLVELLFTHGCFLGSCRCRRLLLLLGCLLLRSCRFYIQRLRLTNLFLKHLLFGFRLRSSFLLKWLSLLNWGLLLDCSLIILALNRCLFYYFLHLLVSLYMNVLLLQRLLNSLVKDLDHIFNCEPIWMDLMLRDNDFWQKILGWEKVIKNSFVLIVDLCLVILAELMQLLRVFQEYH